MPHDLAAKPNSAFYFYFYFFLIYSIDNTYMIMVAINAFLCLHAQFLLLVRLHSFIGLNV